MKLLVDFCIYLFFFLLFFLSGRNFKKSAEKAEKDLEFISTNLHIQRLRVTEKDGEGEEIVLRD